MDELVAATKGLSGTFTGVELDVCDTQAFAALINDTAQRYGRLDVLVNNAPSVIGGMVVDQGLADWQANFGIGVDSVFVGVQAASDHASLITGVVLPVDGGKTPQLHVHAFDFTNLDNQAPDR